MFGSALTRIAIVLPSLILSLCLLVAAEPDRDSAQEQSFIQGAALQVAEETLHREAGHAARYLAVQQTVALAVLKQRLAEQVDSAYAVMDALYQNGKDILSEQQLKSLIRDSLRQARFFEGRGYFFVDGMDGKVILMPLHPHMEGRDLLANRDDQGTYIMQGLIDAARRPGGKGYFSYRWYSPQDKSKMDEKVAYVRHFAPYEWLVGAGEYVPAIENSIIDEAVMRMQAVRFGGTGGIGLSSADGKIALFPEAQGETGTNSSLEDSAALPGVTALWERISGLAVEGGGFLTFQWPHPVSGRMETRGAWVEGITTTGRIVYASAQISDFIPPQHGPVARPLLTRGRVWAIVMVALIGSILLAWLVPLRHEN